MNDCISKIFLSRKPSNTLLFSMKIIRENLRRGGRNFQTNIPAKYTT